MEVKLFCVIPELGSIFPVEVDLREAVDVLKKKIKEKKPSAIFFDADLLKLYLAKDGDQWLRAEDLDIKELERNRWPARIKLLMQEELRMDTTLNLNNDAYFGSSFTRGCGDVHVLVELPEESELGSHYRRLGGSGGSFVDELFFGCSPWSYLRSWFPMGEALKMKKQD